MIDLTHIPKRRLIWDVLTFGPTNTPPRYRIPKGKTFLYGFLMGAGGGGGGGRTGAAGTARGGGGGGSPGSFCSFLIPTILIPQDIFYGIGAGGAGGTPSNAGNNGVGSYLSFKPHSTGVFAQGEPGQGGAAGTTTGGGAGGSAADLPVIMPFGAFGFMTPDLPQFASGANGGAHTGANGGSHANSNSIGTGGAGGGGTPTTNTNFNGGNITTGNATLSSRVLPVLTVTGSTGANGTVPVGERGLLFGAGWKGQKIFADILFASCGGAGGGTAGASGTAGTGGEGNIGSGGGGGGGGVTGGSGGRGGRGIIFLASW